MPADGTAKSTRSGTPISPRNDYRDFRCCVVDVVQGVNPRVVMEIVGHSQISVTLNTYSHVSTTVSREEVDGMSGLLWKPDGRRSDEP